MNPIEQAVKNLPGHWFQGSLTDPENRNNMCGLGHAKAVLMKNGNEGSWADNWRKTLVLMNEVAGELYPDRAYDKDKAFPSFVLFNDHINTTEDEVVAVMEKCAIKYDEMVN